MTGDYYRYLAEFVTDKQYESKAADFYKQAQEISTKVLDATHPIRLGLALNYSVCFYEILSPQPHTTPPPHTAASHAQRRTALTSPASPVLAPPCCALRCCALLCRSLSTEVQPSTSTQ